MIKITDIYSKLDEEKSEKGDVNVADLIKDDSKSGAAKAAILKKKWQISSHDITEVVEFKKKKLAAELDKLKGVDESKVNEGGEKDEYEEFFNMKLKKWSVKSPNELGEEDKKKFFDEIEAEWDKENEAAMAFLEEKKACKKKKKEEEVDTKKFDKDKKVNESDELNESVALGMLTGVLVFFAASTVKILINSKRNKNKLAKKINIETDPEKKAKLQKEWKELTEYEKSVMADLEDTKEQLKKKGAKLDAKQQKEADKKLGAYREDLKDLQEEADEIRANRKSTNESLSESEVIDKYTSKYFHFYEKMFALVDTKEKVDEIFESVFTKLTEEKEMNEAREALSFFRKYRLAELGIE